MRSPFAAALAVATTIALSFLILPIVAIFLQIPLGRLIEGMTAPAAVDALIVTLKTNLVANALILLFGTPTAYLIATRQFRGRALLVTAVELPLVLPPAVAGIGLLAAFGRIGLLGGTLGLLRARDRVHPGRGRHGGDLRREPVLPPRRRSPLSRPSTRR